MPDSARFIPWTFPPQDDSRSASELTRLAFNPRGNWLAVSHENADHVDVFDARSGAKVTRLKGFKRVTGLLFLSAEVLLVAAFGGCYRCNLRRSGRGLISDKGWQAGMALSPDGRLLAIGQQYGLLLHDLDHGKTLRQLAAVYDSYHTAQRAAFSARGRYVAAALYGDRATPIVPVWEVETGRRQRVYDTKGYAFAFRGDTLTLAVSADSGYIEIYEPDQGEEIARQFFRQYETPRAMESRDRDRTLAMLMEGGEFIQIDWDSGEVLRRLPPPAGRTISYVVATNAGWTRFAGAVEGGVIVWPGDRA
jgi:WD40 repeat protein